MQRHDSVQIERYTSIMRPALFSMIDVSTVRSWIDAHPLLHDAVIVVLAAALVAGAAAVGGFRWIRKIALRSLTIKRIMDSVSRVDESDIRRAITPDVFASMLDTPQAQARIHGAIGTDDGRSAVAHAMTSDAAKAEIAAAMLDPQVQQRLIVILNTSDEARAAVASVIADLDLRDSIREALESGDLDRPVLDVVFGELGDGRLGKWYVTRGVELMGNVDVARGIARALPHGLMEEKDEVRKTLQGMVAPPVDISEESLIGSMRRQYRQEAGHERDEDRDS
jgi:hypothetical protein